jgi:hypothetical protein
MEHQNEFMVLQQLKSLDDLRTRSHSCLIYPNKEKLMNEHKFLVKLQRTKQNQNSSFH